MGSGAKVGKDGANCGATGSEVGGRQRFLRAKTVHNSYYARFYRNQGRTPPTGEWSKLPGPGKPLSYPLSQKALFPRLCGFAAASRCAVYASYMTALYLGISWVVGIREWCLSGAYILPDSAYIALECGVFASFCRICVNRRCGGCVVQKIFKKKKATFVTSDIGGTQVCWVKVG